MLLPPPPSLPPTGEGTNLTLCAPYAPWRSWNGLGNRKRRLPGRELCSRAFSVGVLLSGGHSRGKTPVAGFQRQTQAWEGALAFHPDQTQPSESIFCLQLPDLLKLPAKLGFIPLFLPLSRPPYYFLS